MAEHLTTTLETLHLVPVVGAHHTERTAIVSRRARSRSHAGIVCTRGAECHDDTSWWRSGYRHDDLFLRADIRTTASRTPRSSREGRAGTGPGRRCCTRGNAVSTCRGRKMKIHHRGGSMHADGRVRSPGSRHTECTPSVFSRGGTALSRRHKGGTARAVIRDGRQRGDPISLHTPGSARGPGRADTAAARTGVWAG